MALSPRTLSILAALFLSGSFIALGYYFSSPLSPQFADASSTDELLKAYAEKDTDADGLPDWQESLYGTDPENKYSTGPGVLDADAVKNGTVKPRFASEDIPPKPVGDESFDREAPVPGSVTDEFAKAFFQDFIERGETGLDEGQNDALIASLMEDFQARVSAKLSSSYGPASVRISTTVSTTDYAARIEQALHAYEVPEDAGNPATLVDEYINKGDVRARSKLVALADAYAKTAVALATIDTPPALKEAHLSLTRSVELLAKATAAVADYEEDPLATVGALGMFIPAGEGVAGALRSISAAILLQGEPAPGAPGAYIVELARKAP